MAVDRNAADSLRLRRNAQRGRAGGLTSGILVNAPLSNTGTKIQLNLDSAGGLESSSSLLRVKTADTSLTRAAAGLSVALRTNGGLSTSSGVGILLNGATLLLGATGLSINAGGVGATQLGVLTTKGDVLGFSTLHLRVPVGANNTVLMADSAQAAGIKWGGPVAVTPLTTKGDLWGFSTVDARLPVGTNGQVIVADSTQTLGLGWAVPASRVLAVSTTNSSPDVSNTTTETDLGVTYGFAANELKTGSVVRAKFAGRFTGDGVGTLTLRLYYGATVIVTSGLLVPPNDANKAWLFEASVVVGSAGAPGGLKSTLQASFHGVQPTYVVDNSTVLLTTTASGTMKLTAQWGTASAAFAIHFTNGYLEIIGG